MSLSAVPTVTPAKAGAHLVLMPRVRARFHGRTIQELGPRFRGGDERECGDAR